MKILVTNDDGVRAPGLRALVQSLPDWAEVLVAAPAVEQSARSHAISLKDSLAIETFQQDGRKCFGVHGTPADCVKFVFSEFVDYQPDLVISGINQGSNTGVSIYYSGTVAAAREAFINHVPAMAISLASKTYVNFQPSCRITNLLLEAYRSQMLPKNMMLSVNVPPRDWDDLQGIKVVRQAPSRFVEEFIDEGEKDGKRIFSLAGAIELEESDGNSDEEVVAQGAISITPLKLDLTNYEAMGAVQSWMDSISGRKQSEKK